MKKIIQWEEEKASVLRGQAKEVPLEHITSQEIKKVLNEMSQALESQDDGVALAAPQIGYPLSIFIVSNRVFDEEFLKDRAERFGTEKEETTKESKKDLVFINPKITKLSKKKTWMPEGCLSERWLYGEVLRSEKAIVCAYDQTGKKFTRGGSGLMAQIFQHEVDHLKGVLFTDKAKNINNEPPEVY